jgi:hypothetical protein
MDFNPTGIKINTFIPLELSRIEITVLVYLEPIAKSVI